MQEREKEQHTAKTMMSEKLNGTTQRRGNETTAAETVFSKVWGIRSKDDSD